MTLTVDTAARTLTAFGQTMPCRIGKSGALPAAKKREGDSATPLGRYTLDTLLVRPDRNRAPVTRLPWRWLHPCDGWSDGANDPAYNRPVRHPHAFSAEQLWREDGLYDLIVTTSHNTPPVPEMGSAIFVHCTIGDRDYTEGCVAIAKAALLEIVRRCETGTLLEIS